MKTSSKLLIAGNLFVVLVAYQNCGKFSSAPGSDISNGSSLASVNPDNGAAGNSSGTPIDLTVPFLASLDQIDAEFLPFLNPLGVLSSDLAPMTSAGTDAGATAAAAASVTTKIDGAAAQIAMLTPAQNAINLSEIGRVIDLLNSYPSAQLSTQAQVLQTANLMVFNEMKTKVAAAVAGSQISGTDNTANFVSALASIQKTLNPTLMLLSVSNSDLAILASSNITNKTVSASDVAATQARIIGMIDAAAGTIKNLGAADKAKYISQLTPAQVALKLYVPSTLSAGAQAEQAAHLAIVNELLRYLLM